MPEEPEVETKDLQEAIQELHEEEAERKEEARKSSWTKYIGLTTAILAVFAAVGALQSGALINEGLIHQIRASDTWNEYQAARQKEHSYTIAINSMLDSGAVKAIPSNKPEGGKTSKRDKQVAPKRPDERFQEYTGQIAKEQDKEKDLMKEARKLEEETQHEIHKHHQFAYSVALIQVAIALGAVSALARVKSVWFMSMVAGAAGVVFFFIGFLS